MDKKGWKTAAKAASVTLAIFIFFGALFAAMNNTQNSMTGEAVDVMRSSEGLIVTYSGDAYLIPMALSVDTNPIAQVKAILRQPPAPFSGYLLVTNPIDSGL